MKITYFCKVCNEYFSDSAVIEIYLDKIRYFCPDCKTEELEEIKNE